MFQVHMCVYVGVFTYVFADVCSLYEYVDA